MIKIILLMVLVFNVLYAEEPIWYNNPSIDGKIVSTGIFSHIYPDNAYKGAMRNALAEIARFLRVNVKGGDYSKESFTNNSYNLDYSSDTLTSTDVILDSVILENTKRIGNTTYVRLSIDKDLIDRQDEDAGYKAIPSSIVSAITMLEDHNKDKKIQKLEVVFKEKYKRELNAIEWYKISKIIDIQDYRIDNIIGYITSSGL